MFSFYSFLVLYNMGSEGLRSLRIIQTDPTNTVANQWNKYNKTKLSEQRQEFLESEKIVITLRQGVAPKLIIQKGGRRKCENYRGIHNGKTYTICTLQRYFQVT